MTQDKDKFRADFEAWYFERCKHANPLPLNDWTFEQFKPVCMAPDGDTYKVDSARDYWQAWQAARASAPQEVPEPGWWRKRADEIELEVARTGSKEAMRCFTDMRTLLQAAAAPQGVPMNVRIAMQSALEGSSDALFEAGKDNKDAEAALDWLAAAPQPVAQTVPPFNSVAQRKLTGLQADGYSITGYALEHTSAEGVTQRGFINNAGFVGWWSASAQKGQA